MNTKRTKRIKLTVMLLTIALTAVWTLAGSSFQLNTYATGGLAKLLVADTTEPPAPEEHTITYKLNGGEYNGSTADIIEVHEHGSKINIHEAPTREGYTFLYWQGSRYDPGQEYTVIDDHVFTAQWEKDDTAEPTDPDEPDTPADPADPGKDKGKGTPAKTVDTGDNNNAFFWITFMGVALAGIIVAIGRRRRDNSIN